MGDINNHKQELDDTLTLPEIQKLVNNLRAITLALTGSENKEGVVDVLNNALEALEQKHQNIKSEAEDIHKPIDVLVNEARQALAPVADLATKLDNFPSKNQLEQLGQVDLKEYQYELVLNKVNLLKQGMQQTIDKPISINLLEAALAIELSAAKAKYEIDQALAGAKTELMASKLLENFGKTLTKALKRSIEGSNEGLLALKEYAEIYKKKSDTAIYEAQVLTEKTLAGEKVIKDYQNGKFAKEKYPLGAAKDRLQSTLQIPLSQPQVLGLKKLQVDMELELDVISFEKKRRAANKKERDARETEYKKERDAHRAFMEQMVADMKEDRRYIEKHIGFSKSRIHAHAHWATAAAITLMMVFQSGVYFNLF